VRGGPPALTIERLAAQRRIPGRSLLPRSRDFFEKLFLLFAFSAGGIRIMTTRKKQDPVTRPDTDFDIEMNRLEFELRQGYEGSIAARAAYQALAADRTAKVELLDAARERLDRAEALKSRIMAKIERLEEYMLSRG
jgi:hypothetical protein